MEQVGPYFEVYRTEFLSADDLVGVATSKAKDLLLKKLTEFLDADDSEYRRVENYFKCLAFRPDVPEPRGEAA